jgi:hypothetical protein
MIKNGQICLGILSMSFFFYQKYYEETVLWEKMIKIGPIHSSLGFLDSYEKNTHIVCDGQRLMKLDSK